MARGNLLLSSQNEILGREGQRPVATGMENMGIHSRKGKTRHFLQWFRESEVENMLHLKPKHQARAAQSIVRYFKFNTPNSGQYYSHNPSSSTPATQPGTLTPPLQPVVTPHPPAPPAPPAVETAASEESPAPPEPSRAAAPPPTPPVPALTLEEMKERRRAYQVENELKRMRDAQNAESKKMKESKKKKESRKKKESKKQK